MGPLRSLLILLPVLPVLPIEVLPILLVEVLPPLPPLPIEVLVIPDRRKSRCPRQLELPYLQSVLQSVSRLLYYLLNLYAFNGVLPMYTSE
jgi:hypothetical protein